MRPSTSRVLIAGGVVLAGGALVSCGTTDDRDSAVAPTSAAPPAVSAGLFTGQLASGESITVAIDGSGRVLVAWPSVRCAGEPADGVMARNEVDPADAGGILRGTSFDANGAAFRQLPDGDGETVEARVSGGAEDPDELAGTLQVVLTSVNGQADALGVDATSARCSSGELRWTARRMPGGDAGSLFAFRDTTTGDLTSFEAMLAVGGNPAVAHPVRGTTLVENISEPCITESTGSDLGWLAGADDDAPGFPGERADDTIAALAARGVPVPPCHTRADD